MGWCALCLINAGKLRHFLEKEDDVMNRNLPFLTGFALGAAFMYAFDPNGGRRRRTLARDQFTRLAHTAGDGLDAAARDLSNRAAGTVAETRRRLRPDRPAGDVLVAGVRNVDNQLEPHDQPGNIPSLQGGSEDTTGVTRW